MSKESSSVALAKVRETSIQNKLDELRNMKVTDVDKYGIDVQQKLTNNASKLLEESKVRDLGNTKESINELKDVVGKQKMMLPILKTPLKRLKAVQNGMTKVSTCLETVESAITEQSKKLDGYISSMLEQTEGLDTAIKELRVYEEAIIAYGHEIEGNENEQLKYQAITNRMSLISGTRVNAEQAQIEAMMIIKSQQEAKYQLQQVVQNVLPILSIQVVNALGIEANKETLKIISKTRDIVGNIVEQNAKDVKNMALELQSNRTKSVVDLDKLNSAQRILNETMEIIAKNAEVEAEINNKMSEDLRNVASDNVETIKKLKESI